MRHKGQDLEEKIKSHSAKIGVIGLGYVGLPLVKIFLEKNFIVYGFDIDPEKVKKLKQGKKYIKHIDFSFFQQSYQKKRFFPTSMFQNLKKADCIIICVPTPLDEKKEPDLGAVVHTAKSVAKYLRPGQLISLESTTFPGTTREVLLPILQESGLKAGIDFYVCFSPEREDPGNKQFSTRNIPKIVGGIDRKSLGLGALLYRQIVERVIEVSSCEVAEATKMLENTFRAVNIALVNELKVLFDKMGIDIWEVIQASSTKPFGFMPFYPGPGWGGHCIPVDPFYLVWKAKEYDLPLKFIELAGEVNTGMPFYVVEKINDALNQMGKSLKGSRILLLGVAYKKNIDDVRESPALVIMDILEEKGVKVAFYDPYVSKIISKRHKRRMPGVSSLIRGVKESDCVVIITDHTNVDYSLVLKNAKIIIDTRNVIEVSQRMKNKVIQA